MPLRDDQLQVLLPAKRQDARPASVVLALDEGDSHLVGLGDRKEGLGLHVWGLAFAQIDDQVRRVRLGSDCHELGHLSEAALIAGRQVPDAASRYLVETLNRCSHATKALRHPRG